MIDVTAATREPVAVTGFMESASAVSATQRLFAGDAPAGSAKSGQRAFCGIMRASTSWSRQPRTVRGTNSPAIAGDQFGLAPPFVRRNHAPAIIGGNRG